MVSLDRLEFADKNVHTLCRPDLCGNSNSTIKSYFPWLQRHENCLNVRPIKFDVTHQIWSRWHLLGDVL